MFNPLKLTLVCCACPGLKHNTLNPTAYCSGETSSLQYGIKTLNVCLGPLFFCLLRPSASSTTLDCDCH
jgi:hypothetical protein